jgi:transaldolase
LSRFERAGFDIETIAVDLQREGAQAFVESWNELMDGLAAKGEMLKKAG